MTNLNLHIDQITLEGFDLSRAQRPQVRAAIQQELGRLFLAHGIPSTLQSGAQISRIPTELSTPGKLNPAHLGQQVARSIYANLQSARY
ncbi:MAG: hypothetical protein AAFN12_05245 [Cyanobacteria bacterium J06560_2]